MALAFSLAHLTLLGRSPVELIGIAERTNYDFVSLRFNPVTPEEKAFPLCTDKQLLKEVLCRLNDSDIQMLDVELARLGEKDKPEDYLNFIEAAAVIGARHILCQAPDSNRRRASDKLARLCELAKPYGLTVDLEFPSWTETQKLADAVEIIESASQDNAGILIDSLHFSRSDSSLEALKHLPRSWVHFAQLCDAEKKIPATEEELVHTARFDRKLPGQGGIELQRILAALPTVPYSLEIPNDRLRRSLGDEEYARQALATTRRYLGEASDKPTDSTFRLRGSQSMSDTLSKQEQQLIQDMVDRGRAAMAKLEDIDQAELDRLCQALAWATANEKSFTRLAHMGVDESGIGDRAGRPGKRFKIAGVLRDVLRQKSIGAVEEIPEKGIVKYAKPAGVIASLIPMTNPALTPPVTGLNALKARDAVIFSPHPRTRQTTTEMVQLMRAALKREGAPEDLFQVIEQPSIPLTQELMKRCDLTMATGGKPMVRAAYSSGNPAYGVGAGNSSIVIDETADIEIAAQNSRMSKTSDYGSGCSADGNIIIDSGIYDAMVNALIAEGGYLCSEDEKQLLASAMWDDKGNRTFPTIACPPQQLGNVAGFTVPDDRKFLMVANDNEIGPQHPFSKEKLTTVMALYRYDGFKHALDIVSRIYAVGGAGHSCGIYSHNDDHIDQLAKLAPVSRMMVRQPQSKANAGAFTNGMPMTSSLGCGVWGGNITNENVSLKHFLNYTWVSRPIPEDRPSDQELFGEFYGTDVP